MAAYGLYSHIQSNRRRSIALLIGLFLLVYVLVYAGALTAEALSRNCRSQHADAARLARLHQRRTVCDDRHRALGGDRLLFPPEHDRRLTGGHEVQRTEEPRLYNILENLCISRGITMPKLKIMESDSLNAFATGMNDKQYSITVTTASSIGSTMPKSNRCSGTS